MLMEGALIFQEPRMRLWLLSIISGTLIGNQLQKIQIWRWGSLVKLKGLMFVYCPITGGFN